MTELLHMKEKTNSAFLAAALGDAMGWPNEVPRKGDTQSAGTWGRMLGSRFVPILEEVRRGEYSDDTQLILAVARSLLFAGPDWSNHFCHTELPAWRLYERGGGRATKAAADAFAKGKLPWEGERDPEVKKYFVAGGNGAAMRILPHVVFRISKDEHDNGLWRDVLVNSIATHGHPRAIIGALAHAMSIACAFRKTATLEYGELIHDLLRSVGRFRLSTCAPLLDEAWLLCAERHFDGKQRFERAWDETVREVEMMLEDAEQEMQRGALSSEVDFLQKIGALTRASNGAGTVSAVAAVFLASRYATDPMAGLQTASRIRGLDSDTVASMCGSILAGINGASWMGSELLGLQDADYIRRMASDLSAKAETSKSWSTTTISCPPKRLAFAKRDLGEFKPDTSVNLPLIGPVQVEAVRILHDRKRSIMISVAVAKAFNGQTIFIYGSQKKQKAPEPVESAVTKVGVRFYTNNLRAIRSFYEGVLEWQPEGVTPNTVVYHSNIVFADARDSGTDLLLSNSLGREALIVEIKNFDAFVKRLAKKSVTPVNDWFVRKSTRPNIVLHDPDGRRIEVFAPRSDAAS
jgi:ADP-ribosylglycohydrolase